MKKNTGFLRMKKNKKQFKNKTLLVNSCIMIASLIIVFFVLNNSAFYGLYNYKVGEVVREDIFLQEEIIDHKKTEAKKKTIELEVEPIFYIDFSKLVESKKNLTDFFARSTEIKESYSNDSELMKRVYAGIEKKNAYGLTEDELVLIISMSKDKLELLKNYAIDITSQNMSGGLQKDDIESVLESIDLFLDNQNELTSIDKNILTKFISGSIVENQFVDEAKTQVKIETELAKVENVTYPEGMRLISKGDIISEDILQVLSDGGLLIQTTKEYFFIIAGILSLILMLWIILHLFLFVHEKKVLESTKYYAILMSLFVLSFLFSRLFYDFSPFMVPIPAFAMMAGIMLTPFIVIFFGLALIVLIYFWTSMETILILAYVVSLLVLALLVRNIKQRSQVVTAGLFSSLIIMIFAIIQTLIFNANYDQLPMNVVFALANGVISSVITIGLMPFFEGFFSILTPFKLLELSNPNKPLLKRLLIEAPGTYHHSVLVGNLAETAAHDIGANSLLTRVAAFYHDVGKLERPYYYKENQLGTDNPHDKLPPQISANIIKNHMTMGIELAQKNKLPTEVIDVMRAHHGTSLIKYFYYQEQQSNPEVDASKFLYSGPKPDSKEAVILMFADSVEAAVRTLETPTKATLSELIDKIVNQKISENQLTNSDISMREIELIKKSFLNVLSGIFHERIVYPEVDVNQISKDTFKEGNQ